jgi:hypothetical protein
VAKVLTPEERVNGLTRLHGEINQLYGAAEEFHRRKQDGRYLSEPVVSTALLESILLPARVLMDFFLNRRNGENDALVAKDYDRGWKCPKPTKVLESKRERINKGDAASDDL